MTVFNCAAGADPVIEGRYAATGREAPGRGGARWCGWREAGHAARQFGSASGGAGRGGRLDSVLMNGQFGPLQQGRDVRDGTTGLQVQGQPKVRGMIDVAGRA
jgi:hypothetical protein